MNNKLNTVKNFIWYVAIAVCVSAVILSLVFVMFRRYTGGKEEYTVDLSSMQDNVKDETVEIGSGVGNARGELKKLSETEDGGEDYLNNVYFLVDSTFINLRQTDWSSQVWGSSAGNLPLSTVNESGCILFPPDGSMISAAEAAMIVKPEVLVIGIGSDSLATFSEEEFVSYYDKLVRDIQSASSETKIVCCGLPGVTESYQNVDNLNITVMSDGNDWVQLVCRDTGAYFLDVREAVTESAALLSKYADSNGKTLNGNGIKEFLLYLRTHGVQLSF